MRDILEEQWYNNKEKKREAMKRKAKEKTVEEDTKPLHIPNVVDASKISKLMHGIKNEKVTKTSLGFSSPIVWLRYAFHTNLNYMWISNIRYDIEGVLAEKVKEGERIKPQYHYGTKFCADMVL